MEPRASEAVGAILNGHWRLIRLIGEGGLAGVYEAESTRGEGKRAIKLLHQQYTRQRAIVERFYAEAKACFNLRHPHIAGVEAYAYAEDGSPYIVMELLHGMSLEEFLRRNQPMTPAMAAPLAYAVLQALSVAHGRGIVHRDLKPANLFLVPEPSGNYTIKVLDFGIAKVMDIAGGIGTKTRTGAVLGTPGYMSPEQVKNAKAVDMRTDLWAAGVVFYEMLCCHHPYGTEDQLARMVAVLRDRHTPLSQHAPHLAGWDDFFDKALHKDPDQRFQSAEEMGETVRHRAQGTPARFVPDGLQTVAIPQMPNMIETAHRAPTTAMPSMQPAPATPASPGASNVPSAQGPSAQGPSAQGPSAQGPSAQVASSQPHQSTLQGGYNHPSNPPAATPHVGAIQVTGSQHGGSVGPAPHGSYPPAAQNQLPAAYADAVRGASHTQISGDRPQGTPTIHSDIPPVHVETARDEEPPALVWWAVVLLATGTFALGVMLGYVLAG